MVYYDKKDSSGNTSIAFDAEDSYKWSGQSVAKAEDFGYFDTTGKELPYIKRDRDLGQTFLFDEAKPKKLSAITVQLGFGTNVVRAGTYGAALSLQILEVSGTPILNKNYSETVEAWHGFPHDRQGAQIDAIRDDYFEGETFKSVAILRGGKFPSKTDFGFNETDSIDHNHRNLKGQYLTFHCPKQQEILFEPNKTYAFLIMLDEMGKNRGFTLANSYVGSFSKGHGIRRDGDGIFPPVVPDPMKNFKDSSNLKAWHSAHFPTEMAKRAAIPPGTNGYPDVCTWRDLVFFIHTE